MLHIYLNHDLCFKGIEEHVKANMTKREKSVERETFDKISANNW